MNIYSLENFTTREFHEVEADSLEEACKKLGWKPEDAYVHRINVVASRRDRLGW